MHTPGPWYAKRNQVWGDLVLNESTNELTPRRKIADFAYHQFTKHGKEYQGRGAYEEQEANARLCAAAVSLLDAAKMVLSGNEQGIDLLAKAVRLAEP